MPDANPPAQTGPAPAPAAASQEATAVAKSPYASTTAQVGVRSLLYLQNPDARDELGDTGAAGEVNIVLRGRSHRFFGWQVGFMGVLADTTSTSAHLLDLVAEVEFAAALNLWLGRMPIPADRTSLSTVWAIAPQTLPGRYGSFAPVPPAGSRPEAGPRLGELCRGNGAVLWGQVRGGRFKYYLGAFGLDQPSRSPLYSARVALSLLDPEPGFRNSSAYFGGKRVLGIGLGAQHRTQGSRPSATSTVLPADFDEVNADVLFEVGNEAAGVLAVEGAFARLWGQNEVVGYQLFALASYLVPLEVGIGRFQPLFRVQHASPGSADDASEFTSIDAQLGYIIDGHRIRANAGYQYSRIGGQPENAILLGVQLQSEVR